jgi:hypothetical protein
LHLETPFKLFLDKIINLVSDALLANNILYHKTSHINNSFEINSGTQMNKIEHSMQIDKSNSPEEAYELFLGDVKNWAYKCIEKYRDQPPNDHHDQLTYSTGWEPYIVSSHDEHVLDFLASEQEKTAAYFTSKDKWHHGYWRTQEAHHGTEHFELFSGFITRVLPGNQTTLSQLVDAAEHIGNWSSDVPEWFDYSTGLFRSLYFGTDGIREDEHELNMPDHLRCAKILMLTFEASRDKKYFDLAEVYSERWAEAVTSNDKLPIGITREGVVYDIADFDDGEYRKFQTMAGETDLDRAENILASGGIQLFLQLWKLSEKDIFLKAAERLLKILVKTLTDPDAGPVADAFRYYRNITGKKDFDQHIIELVENLNPFDINNIGINMPPKIARRPSGVGKRTDMPVWYEDGQPRRHNPILLSVAAEINGDRKLAACAVDLARTYFKLAVQLMPDGREHGCAARTVSAIARGHGRNNNAGMTTSVLLPAIQNRRKIE